MPAKLLSILKVVLVVVLIYFVLMYVIENQREIGRTLADIFNWLFDLVARVVRAIFGIAETTSRNVDTPN